MKPILFNTEMVRAILAGRKSVTRRVVKPQPICHGPNITFAPHDDSFFLSKEKNWLRCRVCGHDPQYSYEGSDSAHHWTPPYRPGDILYVRETFSVGADGYVYKDDEPDSDGWGWSPSIHMPREAARLFLRVTDVKVKRVQDITDEEAEKEGVKGWMVATDRDWDKNPNFVIAFRYVWNNCCSKPRPVKIKGVIDHYESCPWGCPWEDIQGTRTYRGKPWYVIGNPWVWVIGFERISREEALQCQ